MIAVIMIVIFVVAFISGSNAALIVAAIINCFVPDELPLVDEVIEIALLLSRLYMVMKQDKHLQNEDSKIEAANSISGIATDLTKIVAFNKDKDDLK